MEERCSLCGNTELLVDAIGPEEIIKVCKYCAHNNGYPVVDKVDSDKVRQAERGIMRKQFLKEVELGKKEDKKGADKELERIVKKNLKEREYKDLVDNFHWHILHARRLKKLSQKQMAEAIAEPELVVAMAEKKQLPEDYLKVINKMEQFLGAQLFRERQNLKGIEKGEFDIKKADLNEVNVADLRRLREQKAIREAQAKLAEKQTVKADGKEQEDDDEEDADDSEDVEEDKPKKKGFFARLFGSSDEEEPFKGVED